ncbi:MAG TPA: hypothetical protein DCY06_11595 [Bacteroidetes bacterium]|nr:hypothetical protein [Bacteroidota bacterium]
MTKMKFEEFKTFELFPPDIIDTLRASKLIINASSVGMFPDVEDSPINLQNAFTKEQIVFDLVYNPPKTKLLELAEAEGAIVLNGLNMLVHQAAKAFELWTGQQMPIDEIKQSLLQYIQE